MGYGLQIFTPQGQLAFDASLCSGGVCVGLVNIPTSGGTFSFPGAPVGRTPFVIYNDGLLRTTWSYSEPNGVPTFTFSSTPEGSSVGIYLK